VNPFTAASDPFAALAAGIRSLPIWIFHGDADKTVPVEQSRRIVAALNATESILAPRAALVAMSTERQNYWSRQRRHASG
jgi:predicted peptidase